MFRSSSLESYLQFNRKERPPCCLKKCSMRIFQEEEEFWCILLIHEILRAVSITLKSIIFTPPLFLCPMTVVFFILGGLPSQIKLKIMLLIVSGKSFGKLRLELLKINLDKARVLTIFILPI